MKFNKILKFVSSLALSLVLMLGFVTPAFAASNSTTTINLMAASIMRYPLGERQNGVYPSGTLLRAFEDQNANVKVNVTYDSSVNLLNQMIADPNHSADVFLSTDLARMNSAVTANIIKASTVYNLLSDRLVLVGNVNTGLTEYSLSYSSALDWLNDNDGQKIAVGDPAVEPSGAYTKQVFDAMGSSTTWDNILTHATLYSKDTDVLNAVAYNVNQLGSVYETDLEAKPNLNLIVLDRKDANIIYPIGITNAAMDSYARTTASQALVNLLKADLYKTTGSVFKNAGFSPAQ